VPADGQHQKTGARNGSAVAVGRDAALNSGDGWIQRTLASKANFMRHAYITNESIPGRAIYSMVGSSSMGSLV
jgi:hypothetical protein